jgi:hypothetical protein
MVKTLNIFSLLVVLVAGLMATGCATEQREVGTDRGNGSDGDTDGDVDGGSDGDADTDSDSDSDSDTSTNTDLCEEFDFDVNVLPTRVMILMDVSDSMSQKTDGSVKWVQARDAVIGALTNWMGNDGIEFGMDFFPNHQVDGCAVNDNVYIDVAPFSAEDIINELKDKPAKPTCGGATPLCMAYYNFNSDVFPGYAPVFQEEKANRYVIIVSDGYDMCGGEGSEYDICAKYMWGDQIASDYFADNIKTYAIGFHSNDVVGTLDEITTAGGTGMTEKIQANDGPTLEKELDKIAKNVVSCMFELDTKEQVDKDEVNVYTDTGIILHDQDCVDGSGWTWVDDARTKIMLCDGACEQVQDGMYEKVYATFGCETQIVV